MGAKFNRRITRDLVLEADSKTTMAPERAYRILRQLRERAIVEDARTSRQSVGGIKPIILTRMEHNAIKDAIRLLGIRLKLMYAEDKEERAS